MNSPIYESAAKGQSVLVSETHVERLQLVARAGSSTFLVGGTTMGGGKTSGPNPYDLLSASLAACTLMTIRTFADRRGVPVEKVDVSVSHHRSETTGRDVFERVILVEGDVTPTQRDFISRIANLCPVGKTLAQGADINTAVNPEEPPAQPKTSSYYDDVVVRELEIPNVDW